MATLKLTDGLVEAIETAGEDTYIWDTALARFGVRVTKGGARIYLVQYRAKAAPGAGSKTRRITIGQHDGDLWNATKARAAARKILASVDLGKDPFADREEEREARRQAAESAAQEIIAAELRRRDTFKAVAERYIVAVTGTNRTAAETARLLRHDPIPAWADRHVADIARRDVADLLDGIKARSPAIARATYAALRGVFAWALERDLIASSPCERITAPPRPEARDRVLGDDELQTIWAASDGLGFPFGPIVKLLMLTGQRRSEVAGMTWSELDLGEARWRIPKERTKNAKAHEVDLAPQAVAILQSLTRDGPFVFPGKRAPARKREAPGAPEVKAVCGWAFAKRRLDALVETVRLKADPELREPMTPWRLHDLRRTAATGMAAMGFAPHVVERVLNHISGTQSGLVGVYQRHDYRPERKAALAAWGKHVEAVAKGQPAPSNVFAIRA